MHCTVFSSHCHTVQCTSIQCTAYCAQLTVRSVQCCRVAAWLSPDRQLKPNSCNRQLVLTAVTNSCYCQLLPPAVTTSCYHQLSNSLLPVRSSTPAIPHLKTECSSLSRVPQLRLSCPEWGSQLGYSPFCGCGAVGGGRVGGGEAAFGHRGQGITGIWRPLRELNVAGEIQK